MAAGSEEAEPAGEAAEKTPVVTGVALKDYLKNSEGDDSMDVYIKSMVFGGLDGIITTFASRWDALNCLEFRCG